MGLLKSVGKTLKKVAKVAAPVVGFVNPAAGIALGALSGLGEGKNSLKSVGMGAGLGALGAGAGAVGGGGLGGALKSVGSFATKNPELVLGGVSAIQNARDSAKANQMQQQALQQAQQPWNETAGLRQQALTSLMSQDRPNLSSVYKNQLNPFAR